MNTNATKTAKQPDSTNTPTHDNANAMAVLSYVGPLVILSYLVANKDPFVKFHIKQGLVLLSIEIAVWIIGSVIWMLWPFLYLVNICVLVLAIIGIINAVKGEEKVLPIVGKYASYFKI